MMTPGTSSMLRARRRDVNVKPNRRLDRKSSRGMLYENEELRLRTININAEVERGQNDIKKLRRENEQLRREIWGLREEYDRLEGLLGKAKRHGQLGNTSQDEDSDNEEICDDEDAEYDEEEDDDDDTSPCENSADLDNAENQQKASSSSIRTPGQSRRNSLRVEFDGLSIVDEETETVSTNDVTSVEQCAEDDGASTEPVSHRSNVSRQANVISGCVKRQDSETCAVISNSNQVEGSCFNITNGRHRHEQQFFGKIVLPNGKEGVFMSDAMLPNSNSVSNGLPVYGCSNLKGNSCDLESITGFDPNDYHVMNENVWSEIPAALPSTSQNVAHDGSTLFPPSQSHYNYTFTPVDSTLLSNGTFTQDSYAIERPNDFSGLSAADAMLPNISTCGDTRTDNAYLERVGNTVLHEYGVNDDIYFGMGENIEATTTTTTTAADDNMPDYYHKRGGPDLFISGAYPVTKSPSYFPVGGNLDQLLRQIGNRESENVRVDAVTEATGSGKAVAKMESDTKDIPQKDDTENVQEVIDALETQIDSRLNDAVRGVRVVNGNCYVCLAKEDNAGALLEKGLTIRGVKIDLEDVSRDSIVVALSGVPHDVPDSSVARVIANYGTVIGKVERRLYKGVDTGERLVRLKPADADIKDVPSIINLAGSKATLRILRPDEAKEFGSVCVPETPGITGATDDGKTTNALKAQTPNGENPTKSLDSSFSTDRYRSQINVRLKQPNLKTNRSLENIFDSMCNRAQHNTSLPIIGSCDATSTRSPPLKVASETTLSETQLNKPSRERQFNFDNLEMALSPKSLHPKQSDAIYAQSEPEHETAPKQMVAGVGREKLKEPELAQTVQENKITKTRPLQESQSSPEIGINHAPNIFSKLPSQKSKCQNAQFISTTDESTDSGDLHLKSSPQLQSNPFVGNFRTSSPNNASLSGYHRRPVTPVHVNPFISNIPNTNHVLIYQDIAPQSEQSVQGYNPSYLPRYQGPTILSPDLTILPSSDHQRQFFLSQDISNSRACSPYSNINGPYAHSAQPSNMAFISNEAAYMPHSSPASFPGTQPSLPTTIALLSPNQSAPALGPNATYSLPQKSNMQLHPIYLPSPPMPNNVALVSTSNRTVPSTTYVPGNVSVVLASGMSIAGSTEFPTSSDLPISAHAGNSNAAQSANLSVSNASSPNTSTFPPSQQNLNSSQITQGPYPQYPVNEENEIRQGRGDVTENTLDVPKTQSTIVPSSPMQIRKEVTQPKISRKFGIVPRQQSKSSGDEGPSVSPPTTEKHINVNPPPASPGAAGKKVSRKMSCTNSIGSHHNVDNSINESSVGSTTGPNATSSPNTKHKASVVHHRKTSAGVAGGADVPGGGHANVIDISRSSSSGQDSPTKPDRRRRVSIYFNNKKGATKRRDSTFVPNGSSVPSGGILSRSLSLQHTNRYVGGSASDVATGHCAGAETTTNSERERTNSVSSRTSSAAGGLGTSRVRKHSVCSTRGGSSSDVGKVPWCGCWGNGCI